MVLREGSSLAVISGRVWAVAALSWGQKLCDAHGKMYSLPGPLQERLADPDVERYLLSPYLGTTSIIKIMRGNKHSTPVRNRQ